MNITKQENGLKKLYYLGSKQRMLQFIREQVDFVEPSHGTICDLFSGSGVVSQLFLKDRNVIAVDIQHYSKIFCEALLIPIRNFPDIEDIIDRILNSHARQKNMEIFSALLEYEKNCIENLEKDKFEGCYEIIEKGSLFAFMNHKDYCGSFSDELNNCFSIVTDNLNRMQLENSTSTMITRYYGGLYFSFAQALELDAIATFAFSVSDDNLRTKIIAALLGTTIDIVNTVGQQFAQPLKVINADGSFKISLKKKIKKDREKDVYSYFRKWLNYYCESGAADHNFTMLCQDYTSALQELKQKNVSVVYADPPYTRYHYSRYYHVLETICLQDNPSISTKFPNNQGGLSRAIYRADRHQSPFCIRSQAAEAFGTMISGVRELGVPLVLSYSPYDKENGATPRLQTIEQLICIAQSYYNKVKVVSPGAFTHSRFNSTENNYEINHEAERLIICEI